MSYESRGNYHLDTRIGYFNKNPNFTTIYVGNLNFDRNEMDIQDIFAPHGVVSYVKLIKDSYSHESRGIAFIQMPNMKDAKVAIEKLNGAEIDGRILKVSIAEESVNNPVKKPVSKSKRRKPYKAYVSKKDRINVAVGKVSTEV
jgi:RNA recognition motif-containing protein